MNQKAKIRGRAMTVPGGIVYAAGISLLLTILMSGIISTALENGWMSMENSGYAVMLLLFFSAVTGGITAAKKIKHQILAVCIASGAVYFLILLSITALFYGGQYCAVGETAAVVTAGCGIAALLCLRGKRLREKK